MTAYQRSRDSDAAQRADALVFQMEELFEMGMLEDPPDTYHYTILCGTWAKSGQRMAAKRALQILNHMADRASKFQCIGKFFNDDIGSMTFFVCCLLRSNVFDR